MFPTVHTRKSQDIFSTNKRDLSSVVGFLTNNNHCTPSNVNKTSCLSLILPKVLAKIAFNAQILFTMNKIYLCETT